MKKESDFRSNEKEHQIVFWGSVGVGKSWLVAAFVRRLHLMSLTLHKKGNPLRMKLYDAENVEITIQEPTIIRPTDPYIPIQIQTYTFQRWFEGKKKSRNDSVNRYKHVITFIDSSGTVLMQDENPQNDALTIQRNLAAELIRTANSLIIVLPLNILDQPEEINRYRRELIKLLSLLTPQKNLSRSIAICITKLDQNGLDGELFTKPKETIEARFRMADDKLISLLTTEFPYVGHKVQLFGVSSCGYFCPTGKYESNISADGYSPADESKWFPINVEKPFFWIFEQIEQEIQTRIKTPISLPRPRRMTYDEIIEAAFSNETKPPFDSSSD